MTKDNVDVDSASVSGATSAVDGDEEEEDEDAAEPTMDGISDRLKRANRDC